LFLIKNIRAGVLRFPCKDFLVNTISKIIKILLISKKKTPAFRGKLSVIRLNGVGSVGWYVVRELPQCAVPLQISQSCQGEGNAITDISKTAVFLCWNDNILFIIRQRYNKVSKNARIFTF